MSPIQGDTFSATGGVSFAQYAQVAGENADADAIMLPGNCLGP